MIDNITPERIANAILMQYSYSGSYLIVEGQRDNLLYSKFIDKKSCRIIVAFGRDKVIKAIEILNNNKYTSALGIIDKDFDGILNRMVTITNLLYCDFHDIEISMLMSPVFDLIISHHSNATKLQKFSDAKKDVLKHFFELARPIGILKLANELDNLGLVFKPERPEGKPLPIHSFIDKDTMDYLGDDALITTVRNYSQNRGTVVQTEEAIRKKYHELNNAYDLNELCNGHHLTSIIALSLKKAISNYNSNELTQKELEVQIILSYDTVYFQSTTLYRSIKGWERTTTKSILFF